jgi:hypothetical protein
MGCSFAWFLGGAGRSALSLVAPILATATAGACLSGCSVWQDAGRTMLREPAEYAWKLDRKRSLGVYRQWADEAWAMQSGSCAEVGSVDDYALGFRDGFVDYVYAGGEGEPPPVPPRKFWNIGWRKDQNDAAAYEWFAGYRHGAQAAREGGYRERGVVPSAYRSADAWQWNAEAAQFSVSPGVGAELVAPGEPLLAYPDSQAPDAVESDRETLPAPPDGPSDDTVAPSEVDSEAVEHAPPTVGTAPTIGRGMPAAGASRAKRSRRTAGSVTNIKPSPDS